MDRRNILSIVTGVFAGAGALWLSLPFVRSFGIPSYRTRDHIDIKIPKLKENQLTVVSYMNRPIYIFKRTSEQIENLKKPHPDLLDPNSIESIQPAAAANHYRSIEPGIFVAWGICTHLGCAVSFNPPGSNAQFGEPFLSGGFLCPCHGASYDLSGRVFQNMPAPRNLDIPNYEFVDETTIRIRLEENI